MNKAKYLEDVRLGLLNEIKYQPILEEKFGKLKDLGRYSVLDFEGDDCYIELKCYNKSNKNYKYTMIAQNKINKADQVTKDVYFVCVYEEGIFYWKYDKNFELIKKKIGRKDRGIYEEKDYCLLPMNLLRKL